MRIADSGTQGGKRVWPSLETASLVADWANIVFIASLAIGVVATILIVWMANVKESHWDRERERANQHAGELANETARLSMEAERAKASIAAADARAAEASVVASRAQLALEQFRAPRVLTQEQMQALVTSCRPFAGIPFDFAVNPTPEPQALMGQISEALRAAGWIWVARENTHGLAITSTGNPQSGINISFVGLGVELDVSKNAEWGAAVVALTRPIAMAGIAVRVNIANDDSAPPNAVHIFIGVKPQ